MNLDRVRIDVGIGDLVFGMTMAQVESIVGQCSSRQVHEDGCVELSFVDHGIKCEFSVEWNHLLTAVGSTRESAHFFGKGLHGKSKAEVLRMLDALDADLLRTGAPESDESIEIIETGPMVRTQHWFRDDQHYEVWSILRFVNDKPDWPIPLEDYTPLHEEDDVVWPDELWSSH